MRETISVVVPTFGRSQSVRRAVESILAQTRKADEIIVVDDNPPGSAESNDTRAELKTLMSSGQIVVVSTPGGIGGGAARNLGVKRSSGEYLAFLDDDDVFLPDKLETQLEFMLRQNLEMSYQDIEWYRADGRLAERRVLDHAASNAQSDLLRAHLRVPICPTSIFMIRREAFNRTEGFGEVRTGQDWLLMMRCIEAGLRIAYMPGVHVHQYLHNGPRVSLGRNKVEGERLRHERVRSYYHLLAPEDIRFIEFRHNAVLAVSARRSGDVVGVVKYGVRALWKSPMLCIQESVRYLRARSHSQGRSL